MAKIQKKTNGKRAVLHVKVDPVLQRQFHAAVKLEGLTIEKKVTAFMQDTVDAARFPTRRATANAGA